MKNDSSIKFTSIKITIAVIISLILHLVFFTNFNFKQLFISKNNNQSDELEIFVTRKIEKPINQALFGRSKKNLKKRRYQVR